MYQTILTLFAVSGLIVLGLVARKPKRMMPLLIPLVILTSGIMVKGYCLIDEYFTGCAVIGILLATSMGAVHYQKNNLNYIQDLHKKIFLLTMFYMTFQSVRGVIAVEDLRISRFVIYYVMLGVLSFVLSNRYFSILTAKRAALIISVSGLLYFVAYLGHGLFSVLVRGISQFAPQGHEWAGSATAVFPIVIVMPAVIIYGSESKSKLSMLMQYALIILVAIIGFFYDSRITGIILIGYLLLFFLKRRARAIIAILFIIFALFGVQKFIGSKTPVNSYITQAITSTASISYSSGTDTDRWLHIGMAFNLLDRGLLSAIFGDGYYYHKIIFQRTTAFTALMIDTGLMGIFLLFSNFVLVGYKLMFQKGRYKYILLPALAMSFLWLVVAPVLDMVLFYLMIMPLGLIEQLSKSTEIEGGFSWGRNRFYVPKGV